MTVTYTADVASSSIGCFLKLLFRWRGSLYKLLWKEFLLFTIAYYTLSLLYRFALNETARMIFERIAKYCQEFSNLIPLAFVLGFYVSIVVSRWWEQFNKIPWPDRMALFVTAHVHGHDERGRLMRRTMMRYLCLAFVITMHSISPGVKKRFPTFTHMTQAGFMLPNEQKIIEDIKTPHNKYFIPLVWVTSLVTRARKEQRIKDDFAVKTLTDEINAYRGCLGALFNFDWISIPLVYTQVVTWAAYTFFFSCLMGRQFVDAGKTEDVFVPVFTFLQFFFYMGWLKVAECMVNPFGDDDDDFDINSIIDRNLQVSYLVVDEMHSEIPELVKDQYWDDTEFELPYTVAAESYKNAPHLGSAMEISTSRKEQQFIIPPSLTVTEAKDNEEIANVKNIPQRSKQRLLPGDHSSYRVIRPLGIFHNFRRSQSRNPRAGDLMESPDLMSRSRRSRKNSESSQVPSEAPTPSINANSEDIFQMSDLEGEDDVDELAASSKSKVSFFNKIANLLKTKSQRNLSISPSSKTSGLSQRHPVDSTVSLAAGKGCVTVVSVENSSPGENKNTVQSAVQEPAAISEESESSPTNEMGPLLENMESSQKKHISKVTEDETFRALEDLQNRRDTEKRQKLPRAATLLGQDVAHELGLELTDRSQTTTGQSRSESAKFISMNTAFPK